MFCHFDNKDLFFKYEKIDIWGRVDLNQNYFGKLFYEGSNFSIEGHELDRN